MIGIVTNYAFNEHTANAVSLADAALSIGIGGALYSVQPPEDRVNPHWDSKIQHPGKCDFETFAARCSHIVWTHPDDAQVASARKMGRCTYLLADWTQLSPTYKRQLKTFDRCICPSKHVFNHISLRLPEVPLAWVPWDPGTPLLNRHKTPLTNRLRVYCPIRGNDLAVYGTQYLSMLDLLLKLYKHLEFSVVVRRAVPPTVYEQSRRMVEKYGARFKIIKRPNSYERAAELAEADWTLWLPLQENSCHDALESLYAGVPVVSWTLQPTASVLLPGRNSALLDVPTFAGEIGAEKAVPDWLGLFDSLSAVLRDERLFDTLQSQAWADLESRRRAFYKFWQIAWDLHYPDKGEDDPSEDIFYW